MMTSDIIHGENTYTDLNLLHAKDSRSQSQGISPRELGLVDESLLGWIIPLDKLASKTWSVV